MLILIGGKEVDTLFKHVGMVVKEDTFQQAIKKIKDGFSKQTNQSMARFKLMVKVLLNGGLLLKNKQIDVFGRIMMPRQLQEMRFCNNAIM